MYMYYMSGPKLVIGQWGVPTTAKLDFPSATKRGCDLFSCNTSRKYLHSLDSIFP